MKKKLCIFLILIPGLALFAQTSDEWYWNLPITSIQFEGLQNVAENDLQGIIEPFIGNEFTDTILNDLQRRLYNLEFFDLILPEAVSGDAGQSILILKFIVEERPILSEIRFLGNQQVRRGTLLDEIVLKTGDISSQSKLMSDQDRIIELYRERGFADIAVNFRLEEPNEGNTQVLVFVISEGIQTNVRSIKFSGISFASENQLLAVMVTKQQGLFSPGTFKFSNLELDRQAILNFYAENGYIDAQVLNIEQEQLTVEETGRQFLEITYFIDEGIPWFFGGLGFEGNTIFADDELAARFFLEEGSILNLSLFQQGFQAISDLYYQGGYIFNQIDVVEDRDEALQQINFTITIAETGRAYIENIIIRGNTKTREDAILRELPFEEGDVFSATKIREGIANLYNTQYFGNVPAVETPQGSVPGLMDLVINLEEGQTTDIRLGFTVGGEGDFPIAGVLKLEDTNFLGNGQRFGADLNISPTEQSLSVNFYDAWLFGDRWGGGASLGLTRTVQNAVLQDILYPVFGKGDPHAVPDPFQGYYVFKEDTTYNGTNYKAGEPFPDDSPNAETIENHDLLTDYSYFLSKGGSSSDISNDYKMEYIQWSIIPSISTGVRIPTALGWFGISSGLSFVFSIIEYDETLYRPFNSSARENLRMLRLINTLSLTLSLDARDIFFNPQNGYLIRQQITYAGGFLGGTRNYIRTDTTLQGFLTLFNLEVSPTWSWKMVLAANVSLSFMLEQFFVYPGSDTFEAGERELLRTDSMSIARGWPRRRNGQALFNSWIELRMPFDERILWFDLYAEAVRITEDREIFAPGSDNWLFGFGAGLRFTIQQFPFRIYLGKRFRVNNGQVEWQKGNLFADPNIPDSGLDLIFAISFFN